MIRFPAQLVFAAFLLALPVLAAGQPEESCSPEIESEIVEFVADVDAARLMRIERLPKEFETYSVCAVRVPQNPILRDGSFFVLLDNVDHQFFLFTGTDHSVLIFGPFEDGTR